MDILIRPEKAKLPSGRLVEWPIEADYFRARMVTKQQETLWNELQKLAPTEQGQGRALSIQREVGRLEALKHPVLQIQNSPWFPKEWKLLTGTPG